MSIALVGAGETSRQDRRPTQARGGRQRFGDTQAAVAPRTGGADDARPDRAHDRLVALGGRPQERRGGGDARGVTVRARAYRDRHLDEPALLEGPHGVRERDRQRSSWNLDVGETHAVAHARARRSDLTVELAAEDRKAAQALGERSVLLGMPD